jgi:hypothetical protein
MMGIVDWATGDFLAAAPRLRRVAELYAAGSGNVTDLRYSQDHSVWSLSLLALALWPLGFVDQAIEAASKALARAQQINHAMTTLSRSFSDRHYANSLGPIHYAAAISSTRRSTTA